MTGYQIFGVIAIFILFTMVIIALAYPAFDKDKERH